MERLKISQRVIDLIDTMCSDSEYVSYETTVQQIFNIVNVIKEEETNETKTN